MPASHTISILIPGILLKEWHGSSMGGWGGSHYYTTESKTCLPQKGITRWWFHFFYIFTPTWGNDPVWILTNIFQMGWNHQLDYFNRTRIVQPVIFRGHSLVEIRGPWNLEFALIIEAAQVTKSKMSHEKNPSLLSSVTYWLFNRDPYIKIYNGFMK